MVRQLVDMLCGTVTAGSAGQGRGSEFVVCLPTVPFQEAELVENGDCAASARKAASPRRVLIVDDNVDAAESLAVVLRIGGHELRTAHDGPAALQAAQAFRPEVILLDIGLPMMDGYEVARRLRATPGMGNAVLVALTGYGQEEDRRQAASAGFDVHLTKPASLAALQAVLSRPGN